MTENFFLDLGELMPMLWDDAYRQKQISEQDYINWLLREHQERRDAAKGKR